VKQEYVFTNKRTGETATIAIEAKLIEFGDSIAVYDGSGALICAVMSLGEYKLAAKTEEEDDRS
jgi:hypothetical protein